MIYQCTKRLFDICFSIVVLTILFFPMLFISVLIKASSKGPIFYNWRVVGKNGVFFNSYKFRTMVVNADKLKKELKTKNEMSGPFFKMKNDPRITWIGRLLRKYSIDELPQFISVLQGSMSIVGPRPPLQSEYENFSNFQKQKLAIKPGITCLWQVDGRNNIDDADEWIKKDLEYISKRSFIFDLSIILRTIITVFRGTGK
jgi:lipopolysaccharide/colanic/teichoic acid biosynthesis glycosyltransferase